MEKLRLDRFISNQTGRPRSDVKKLIYWSKVTLNGKSVHSCDVKIDPESDKVTVLGKEISYRKNIYIMMNKPRGVVCSTRDGNSPTVLSLLSDDLKNRKDIFPAGRLDKDTTGFVLITNDGELSHRILSPKKHIPKYYFVKLAQPYFDEYKSAFSAGIVLENGEKCLPANVRGLANHAECAVVELHEGKFHQVKRMFEAVGNSVSNLARLQLGGLPINAELQFGEYLEIMHNDVEKLFAKSSFEDVFNKVSSDFWAYLINNNL